MTQSQQKGCSAVIGVGAGNLIQVIRRQPVRLLPVVETSQLQAGLGVTRFHPNGLIEKLEPLFVGYGKQAAHVALDRIDAKYGLCLTEGLLRGRIFAGYELQRLPRKMRLQASEIFESANLGILRAPCNLANIDYLRGEAQRTAARCGGIAAGQVEAAKYDLIGVE
jgi:hypothetical protein